jgi:hypothetical protein
MKFPAQVSLFLLLTLLLVPLGAQEHVSDHARAGRVLKNVLARHRAGLSLKIAGAEPLRISCPMGVLCGRNFDYRALTYEYRHPDFDTRSIIGAKSWKN